jgi:hypothetical protein
MERFRHPEGHPMRYLLLAVAFLCGLATLVPGRAEKALSFEMKEIETKLGVGYAVRLVDVDRDGKLDIVVVDTHRVVWYQNPTWKQRTIIKGKTIKDNVCIAPYDIDGDGRIDFALGAAWKPFDTKGGGTLQWLRQPKDLDKEWDMFPISSEPMLHRIRFIDIDGSGKPALVVGPLMGRNSTGAGNWMDGRPLRVLAYRVPKDPAKGPWKAETLNEDLHVMHNFTGVPAEGRKGKDILTASYEGVHRLYKDGEKWRLRRLGTGNQEKPTGSRGASEIKQGKLKDGTPFIATIEPWHGHQVVVYTPPKKKGELWQRQVLDDKLKWGHAVWCADLDGDGGDELIIGVRDNLSKAAGEKCGVRIYKWKGGTKWERQLVDEGGVAVEDLAVADLDGDGKLDIVAVGRATHNVRIYRNLGMK